MGKKMNMNISVNGQSRVPPGFRFHPTEEELLQYYLRKKVANENIDLDVIFEVDLNKLEPWDIQEKCSIGTAPQNDWYFFSHKDKKYPTGTRTNRATTAGFWKATGRDKVIFSNGTRIGMRKTLVFYQGRAPHGLKSDWIMHEYRLHHLSHSDSLHHTTNGMNEEEGWQEEGWVVCRIFKKKNHIKTQVDSSTNTTFESQHHSTTMNDSTSSDHHHHNHDDQGALEQIFQIIKTNPTTPYIQTTTTTTNNNNLLTTSQVHQAQANTYTYYQHHPVQFQNDDVVSETGGLGLSDWAALDRFVATHLNGQTTTATSLPADHHRHNSLQLPPLVASSSSTSSPCNKIYQPDAATLDSYGGNEIDLWSLTG